MQKRPNSKQNIFLWLLFVIGWMAIVAQFCLLLYNRKLPVLASIVQFFSYFTILTNILVALYSSFILFSPFSKTGKWLSRPTVTTAIAVYILIVGAVYNVILRFLWSPEGLQELVDEALHSFIPFTFLLYWFLFVTKKNLEWKNVFAWLVYPFIYLLYVLIRGAITGLYPYPFIDVTVIGYPKAALNSAVLLIIFLLVCLLFISMGKIKKHYSSAFSRSVS